MLLRFLSGLVPIVLAVMLVGCGSEDDSTQATSSGQGGGSGGGDGTGGQGGAGGTAPLTPIVELPKSGLSAEEIGLLVNDQDPQSVAVAAYYQQARGIPDDHVYTLSFTPGGNVLPPEDFGPLWDQLQAEVGAEVQAYAISWTTPYRVGCMSATAAFALGFDTQYCNTTGMACGPTAPVSYFNADSFAPFDDHGIRPAMMLAGATTEDAEALIDTGVLADGTFPGGDGYLIRTTDTARSVRWQNFISTQSAWDYPEGLTLSYIDNASGAGSNVISDTQDVLFYFTGLAQVPDINTNTYLPGAVADHLTSFGGRVPTSGQMSIARWLEAGATASYGTVVEPCNYTTKFPNTLVLLPHYFRGETVIEAYWKSVQWPGEGNFAGEPLAKPWGVANVDITADSITIETTTLDPSKVYEVAAGQDAQSPLTVVMGGITVPQHQLATITITPVAEPYYQLRQAP